MNYIRRFLAALMLCFCLTLAALPAQEAYASGTETAEETEDAKQEDEETEDAKQEDEETFFFIMMGGALLIVIVAVVTAVSTVSSSIAVAANMDVDGE